MRTFTESATYDAVNDVPQAGISVTVTDAAGNSETGITDVGGMYVLGASSALVGGKYRVEISIPSSMDYLEPAFAKLGGSYSSFVSFVDVSAGANATVRTAVWNPADYAQVNPPLAVPIHPQYATDNRALVRWLPEERGEVTPQVVQDEPSVGAVYGTAFHKATNRLFSGAYAKRHFAYGPGGAGAIYVSDANGGPASVFATVPNAGSTAHTANTPTQDYGFFAVPGTESLGDIEINEMGTILYAVNLADKRLYSFSVADGAPAGDWAIPDPGCAGGEWRPMGLGFRDGRLYVGGVCDAMASQNAANLEAVVWVVDEDAPGTFTEAFAHGLQMPRGAIHLPYTGAMNEWKPWINTFALSSYTNVTYYARPMPMLSDITFDRDGSMILGFRDRNGDQTAWATNSPDNGASGLFTSISGGDIVRACYMPSPTTYDYQWEGENGCAANATQANGGQSANIVEFFPGESTAGFHQEPMLGSTAVLYRTDQVVSTSYDPTNIIYTQGVQYMSLSDGSGAYLNGAARGSNFGNTGIGKGTGLGDLTLLANPAPLQIGNVVWFDSDRDGIQDPDEQRLPGIVVNLLRDGTVIGTRTTDANGEYYFSSIDADLGGEFVPNGGDYEVEFVKPTTGTLTVDGQTHNWTDIRFTTHDSGSKRSIDSNPDPATGRTTYTAGGPGQDDHTLDAGFVVVPADPGYEHTKTSDPVSGSTVVGGSTITYTLTGTNTGGTVLDPVEIEDDLSKVLDNSALAGPPTYTVYSASGDPVSTGEATLTANLLTWSGALEVGEYVEVVYSVVVDSDAQAGVILENHMSSSATPPDEDPIEPPDVITEHPVPGYAHSKASDPAAGTSVSAGDSITYTVKGENFGATVLEPVTVQDDMAEVLDKSTLDGDPVFTIYNEDDTESSSGTVAPIGTMLVWNGVLQPGQRVEIVYTVTLDDDVEAGATVRNHMSSSATPPGEDPIVPEDETLDHPVPGFAHSKTSTPESGSPVMPGDTIAYVLTGSNTGGTVLDPVRLSDDLTDVFEHATLVIAPTYRILDSSDSVVSSGTVPIISQKISWAGQLQPGQRVEISYMIRLKTQVTYDQVTIGNELTSSATPPGKDPIDPPPATTEHPVPGYTHSKISNPESGATVGGGDTITYTVTGSNTGATVLDPVVVTDDLADVLNNAALTAPPVYTVLNGDGSVSSTGEATVTGTTLTWAGALEVGQLVKIVYTLTINADIAPGTVVNNHMSSSATPPGLPPITPVDVITEHPVPGYEHSKTSDPASGSTVVGGDDITYTLTGTNTGATVLEPVVITDDLSNVLNNAEMTAAPVFTIFDADGSVADTGNVAVLFGTLLWSGSLDPGQYVTIVYTVTIDGDAPAGTIVSNTLSSSATPPGEDPIKPDDENTEHLVPSYSHSKTSDPESGATVVGGDDITYTLGGVNTGTTVLDPVVITDDLTNVLNNAAITSAPVYTIYDEGGAEVSTGSVAVSGTTLTWMGVLQPGEHVEIVYTVMINEDVAPGTVVNNHLSSSATPPGEEPIVPADVVTEHPVPGYTHSKVSNPVSGTTVVGGDDITYTVTGTNTGATVLDPVVITDDLSNVLDHAVLDGEPVATVHNADGSVASTGNAELDGETLTWTGSLEPGQYVTVVYTVTIDADVPAGTVVNNHLSSSATPPGEEPIVPEDVITEHPVPGYEHSKVSDPVSGTTVVGGDAIIYTVTGTNSGATVLDPVVIVDDLSSVLNNAAVTAAPAYTVYNDDGSIASTGSVPLDGTSLTWTGRLEVGQHVTVAYTVMINEDVAPGTVVNNHLSSSATPPGEEPIVPADVVTEHPVPGYTHSKVSNPVSGTTVVGGDDITYTVTGTNTGATVLDPVVITDDLIAVLNHSELTAGPMYTVFNADGTVAAEGSATRTGTMITWTGVLEVGQRIEIVYTVTIDADVPAGTVVNNHLSSSATPPGKEPIVPEDVITEHPVPGYEHSKTSDPVGGTTVVGGDEITYTVTGRNTGATVLDPVVITDEMSDVLNNAVVTSEPVYSVYNADGSVALTGTLLVDDTKMTWNGVLEVGQYVQIVYTVTIDRDVAPGTVVNNHLASSATPPGKDPIVPEDVEIAHPTPGFELMKSADPANGTPVNPGGTITYTVTGTNTGGSVLDPVEIEDNLSDVLNHAELLAQPRFTIQNADGSTVSTGRAAIDEAKLSWTGTLQPGQRVVIVYTVLVESDAAGVVLNNVASGQATPPDLPPIVPPPAETAHPVPGYVITKTSDPKSGSKVTGGDIITYTVTASNIGATVLDPVIVTDDLSKVLNNATLVGTVRASTGQQPLLDGTTLTWVGALQPGEKVILEYQVKVKAGVTGVTLMNTVTSQATPPGLTPLNPAPASTEHIVPPPPLPETGLDAVAWSAGLGLAALLIAMGVTFMVQRRRATSER